MGIDLLKVPATKKPSISGEWRGMWGAQDQVFAFIDHRDLSTRSASPQHKHQALPFAVEDLDDPIGQPLPAPISVTIRLVCSDGEHRIEQQNPLFCPRRELAMLRNGKAKGRVQLLENILERRRHSHPLLNRETQPMSLAWPRAAKAYNKHNKRTQQTQQHTEQKEEEG